MSQTKISEDAIRDLCNISTRDNAGRHFTEFSNHWRELEDAGLIMINRPVHITGTPYSQEYWTIDDITHAGQDLVDANPELHPA